MRLHSQNEVQLRADVVIPALDKPMDVIHCKFCKEEGLVDNVQGAFIVRHSVTCTKADTPWVMAGPATSASISECCFQAFGNMCSDNCTSWSLFGVLWLLVLTPPLLCLTVGFVEDVEWLKVGGCGSIAAAVVGIDSVIVLCCRKDNRPKHKWIYRIIMLILSVILCFAGIKAKTCADVGANGVVGVGYACIFEWLKESCISKYGQYSVQPNYGDDASL